MPRERSRSWETVIGLDLAATLRKAKVGVAVVGHDRDGPVLREVMAVRTTDEILKIVDEVRLPALLAIDAPLKLPFSCDASEEEIAKLEGQWDMVYTYRPWEDLIFNKCSQLKVSGRPFSSLSLTYRAQILKGILEKRRWKLISSPWREADGKKKYFTEVFPNLTMAAMGTQFKSKGEKESKRLSFVEGLFQENSIITFRKGRLVGDLADKEEDILDAIICAWTGVMFLEGSTICLGDDRYGFVICPQSPELKRAWGGPAKG